MNEAGSRPSEQTRPLWVLAELTYACPLQCPYCSNPVDYASTRGELDTADWIRVLEEARALGATQLGLSGGEPLVRRDLEEIIGAARRLGYYTNLITSGVGMDAARVKAFKDAGLDHIQISFQSSDRELNDIIAGTTSFEHKLEMARAVKENGFPMVLCFPLHRRNIEQVEPILELASELKADYVELATVQYYGWALLNRDELLPTREQLQTAESTAKRYRDERAGKMKIYYVVPDYYEERPKACMNGWGSTFLTIAPDGTALPCHAARQLPGLEFPNVRDHSVGKIWYESEAFEHFRGFGWMKEPCRSCSEKEKDFGGCRCQAYMLTGDAANADPVCSKSPHHEQLVRTVEEAATRRKPVESPLVFRNPRNSKRVTRGMSETLRAKP